MAMSLYARYMMMHMPHTCFYKKVGVLEINLSACQVMPKPRLLVLMPNLCMLTMFLPLIVGGQERGLRHTIIVTWHVILQQQKQAAESGTKNQPKDPLLQIHH